MEELTALVFPGAVGGCSAVRLWLSRDSPGCGAKFRCRGLLPCYLAFFDCRRSRGCHRCCQAHCNRDCCDCPASVFVLRMFHFFLVYVFVDWFSFLFSCAWRSDFTSALELFAGVVSAQGFVGASPICGRARPLKPYQFFRLVSAMRHPLSALCACSGLRSSVPPVIRPSVSVWRHPGPRRDAYPPPTLVFRWGRSPFRRALTVLRTIGGAAALGAQECLLGAPAR